VKISSLLFFFVSREEKTFLCFFLLWNITRDKIALTHSEYKQNALTFALREREKESGRFYLHEHTPARARRRNRRDTRDKEKRVK